MATVTDLIMFEKIFLCFTWFSGRLPQYIILLTLKERLFVPIAPLAVSRCNSKEYSTGNICLCGFVWCRISLRPGSNTLGWPQRCSWKQSWVRKRVLHLLFLEKGWRTSSLGVFEDWCHWQASASLHGHMELWLKQQTGVRIPHFKKMGPDGAF